AKLDSIRLMLSLKEERPRRSGGKSLTRERRAPKASVCFSVSTLSFEKELLSSSGESAERFGDASAGASSFSVFFSQALRGGRRSVRAAAWTLLRTESDNMVIING